MEKKYEWKVQYFEKSVSTFSSREKKGSVSACICGFCCEKKSFKNASPSANADSLLLDTFCTNILLPVRIPPQAENAFECSLFFLGNTNHHHALLGRYRTVFSDDPVANGSAKTRRSLVKNRP